MQQNWRGSDSDSLVSPLDLAILTNSLLTQFRNWNFAKKLSTWPITFRAPRKSNIIRSRFYLISGLHKIIVMKKTFFLVLKTLEMRWRKCRFIEYGYLFARYKYKTCAPLKKLPSASLAAMMWMHNFCLISIYCIIYSQSQRKEGSRRRQSWIKQRLIAAAVATRWKGRIGNETKRQTRREEAGKPSVSPSDGEEVRARATLCYKELCSRAEIGSQKGLRLKLWQQRSAHLRTTALSLSDGRGGGLKWSAIDFFEIDFIGEREREWRLQPEPEATNREAVCKLGCFCLLSNCSRYFAFAGAGKRKKQSCRAAFHTLKANWKFDRMQLRRMHWKIVSLKLKPCMFYCFYSFIYFFYFFHVQYLHFTNQGTESNPNASERENLVWPRLATICLCSCLRQMTMHHHNRVWYFFFNFRPTTLEVCTMGNVDFRRDWFLCRGTRKKQVLAPRLIFSISKLKEG